MCLPEILISEHALVTISGLTG